MATSPAEFQRQQAATAQGVLLLVRRQWVRMASLDDWPTIASRVTLLTAAGQAAAARRAAEWTAESFVTLGAPEPVAAVNPQAFAGVASDGRPLDSLLYSSVVHARNSYASTDLQLESGRKWLATLAKTMIADAGRGAAQAQMVATPRTGYVRAVRPPSCQACAALAGKDVRWSVAFERHPGCDCVHVPRYGDLVTDDYTYDPQVGDIYDLTAGQRMALEDGGDLGQVINAYRGATPAQRAKMLTTTEGTTKRGWYAAVQREAARQRGEVVQFMNVTNTGRRGYIANYKVRRTAPRLTPDAIYKVSQTREEAVRLLARNGYLQGSLSDVARLANEAR